MVKEYIERDVRRQTNAITCPKLLCLHNYTDFKHIINKYGKKPG